MNGSAKDLMEPIISPGLQKLQYIQSREGLQNKKFYEMSIFDEILEDLDFLKGNFGKNPELLSEINQMIKNMKGMKQMRIKHYDSLNSNPSQLGE